MRLPNFSFLVFLFMCACTSSAETPQPTGPDNDKLVSISCEGDDTRGYLWTARITPVQLGDVAPVCLHVEYREGADTPLVHRTIYAEQRSDYYFGSVWSYEASCDLGNVKMASCADSFPR